MVSTAANDYLTKQLSVTGNIVTFRSLSRELGIHVNEAKNELASYHALNASSSCATYLLSGEVSVPRKNPYDMEVDMNMTEEDEEDYDNYGCDNEDLELTRSKTVIVPESQLEATQSKFVSPPSIHVYSLSPAPLKSSGLICTPTPHLRAIDLHKEVENAKDAETITKQRNDWAKVVGKIIGDHVSFKPNKKWSIPSAPKIKPGGPVVVPSKSSATATTSTTVKEADPKRKATEKPKPTGKLDWSNAKTKEQKAAENKEKKSDDAKVKKEEQEKKAKRDEEMRVKKEEAKKKKEQMAKERERETVKMEVSKDDHKKRARALLSDSDSDSEPLPPARQPTKPVVKSKGKKAVVLSSDEEEDAVPEARGKKRLLKGKKTERDKEINASLQAMMDSDDDQIIRVSRPSTSASASIPPTDDDLAPSEEMDDQPISANTDVEMEDDIDIVKPQPRKRKPKKVIPVGRNGLKKRRVEKSRMKEENGYTVTEDYSSYESVDGENESAPPEPKIQAKAKPEAKKVKMEEPASKNKLSGVGGLKPAPPAKIKSTVSRSGSGSGKGGIANFFTKK